MRPSKRREILRAAVDLIESEGMEALTYDRLAQATGVNKSGLIYHFPTRHALLLAVHGHLADQWEEEIAEAAGGADPSEISAERRLRALVASLSASATRADLLMQLDAEGTEEFQEPWRAVDRRWTPQPEDVDASADGALAYVVMLAAEGLWMHDHVHFHRLSPQRREILTRAITGLIPGAD